MDGIPWPSVRSPPRPACTWPPPKPPSAAFADRCADVAPSARTCPATPRHTRSTAWTTPPAAPAIRPLLASSRDVATRHFARTGRRPALPRAIPCDRFRWGVYGRPQGEAGFRHCSARAATPVESAVGPCGAVARDATGSADGPQAVYIVRRSSGRLARSVAKQEVPGRRPPTPRHPRQCSDPAVPTRSVPKFRNRSYSALLRQLASSRSSPDQHPRCVHSVLNSAGGRMGRRIGHRSIAPVATTVPSPLRARGRSTGSKPSRESARPLPPEWRTRVRELEAIRDGDARRVR